MWSTISLYSFNADLCNSFPNSHVSSLFGLSLMQLLVRTFPEPRLLHPGHVGAVKADCARRRRRILRLTYFATLHVSRRKKVLSCKLPQVSRVVLGHRVGSIPSTEHRHNFPCHYISPPALHPPIPPPPHDLRTVGSTRPGCWLVPRQLMRSASL